MVTKFEEVVILEGKAGVQSTPSQKTMSCDPMLYTPVQCFYNICVGKIPHYNDLSLASVFYICIRYFCMVLIYPQFSPNMQTEGKLHFVSFVLSYQNLFTH